MKKRAVVFAGNGCKKNREEYYYSLAYETGKILAREGFTIVTGGGPGLMDKVSQGAYQNGGYTIGVCLDIEGVKHSEYLKEQYHYSLLRERQGKLLSLGDAFIALPGGIGTLYEITEVMTLRRKNEISAKKPLILMDDYYREFIDLISKFNTEGFINGDAVSLFNFALNPSEVINYLK